MKLFKRKAKTAKMPMKQKTRNTIGAVIGVVGLLATIILAAPAAQAATMSACYISAAGPDHHLPFRHGEVYASVDYTWAEEVFLGQKDGYRFFGTTSADKIDTRPYWVKGC